MKTRIKAMGKRGNKGGRSGECGRGGLKKEHLVLSNKPTKKSSKSGGSGAQEGTKKKHTFEPTTVTRYMTEMFKFFSETEE
jgi:hypothetical protein